MPLSREYYFNILKDNKKIAEEIQAKHLLDSLNILEEGKYIIQIIKIDYYTDGYPAGTKILKQIQIEV